MANDASEALLVKIVSLLSEDQEYPIDGTLLYARLDRNMVAPSIFKDAGNHIMYRSPDLDRLGDALLDLWEEQKSDDRWSEIECLIKGGKFETAYSYPDDIDPNEENFDRRDRVVRKYFGEKPILYPPWSEEDDDPVYDL